MREKEGRAEKREEESGKISVEQGKSYRQETEEEGWGRTYDSFQTTAKAAGPVDVFYKNDNDAVSALLSSLRDTNVNEESHC